MVTQITGDQFKDGSLTDADVAAANIDGTAGTPSMRTLGTGAQQACAGDDMRLSGTGGGSGVVPIMLAEDGLDGEMGPPGPMVTAHSALSGLINDDHPQYHLSDGSRPLTGNVDAAGVAIQDVSQIQFSDLTYPVRSNDPRLSHLAMPGMDGDDGADGFDGRVGPAGADGAAGVTGAQGPTGPAIYLLDDIIYPDPDLPRTPWCEDFQRSMNPMPTIGSTDGVAQRLVTYQNRQPRYWIKNSAATSFTSVGMFAVPTVTSNTAGGASGDTTARPVLTIDTPATNNVVASIVSSTACVRRSWLPTLVVPFHAGNAASQAAVRRWIGFWSADLSATATPTTQATAAFRYDTVTDGTAFWRCITCDAASNVTTTTTTVAAGTASQENTFRIEMDGALGHVCFYIDDIRVAMHSTNLPVNTTLMYFGVLLTNLDATARVCRVGSITLIHA